MSEFFKNKKRLILSLSVMVLAITLVSGTMAVLLSDKGSWLSLMLDKPAQSGQESGTEPGEGEEPEFVAVDAPAEDEPASTLEPEPEEPAGFRVPSEIRGVYITPGVDILTDGGTAEAAVRSQVDKALQDAVNLTMNAVIIDTVHGEKVLFQTVDAPSVSKDFDIMGYIVEKAREKNLYTYAIFDASFFQRRSSPAGLLAVGAGTSSNLTSNLREFAIKYKLDGILLDGYQNLQSDDSYNVYLMAGGAIGFGNYMRETPAATVKSASKTIRECAKSTQVGLLADAVWQNAEQDEGGSQTKASYTAMGTANADTKGFVEDGLVDFVAVKNYSSLTDDAVPFSEVVSWWSDVAQEQGIPMYVVHASDKICTEQAGWEPHDQLTRQVIQARDYGGYQGSVFNNLSRMVANPKDATATLVKYYNNEIEAAHILTELEITKPEQTTYTTFEPIVTFTGASDPNSDVTINGEVVPTDASGYFTVTYDLDAGLNTYKIEHKEKLLTYSITRQIQVLGEISPTGSIATEGGMTLTITAMAYSDATVTASIGGKTVAMAIDEESVEDEQDRDSNFKMFVGEYTVPAASGSEQNLGAITVTASWEGHTESKQGATVKVNKKAKIENGVPVVITASQARTYPPNTLNNIPHPSYYPLPQGAMDYAVGDEIVYKNDKNTYTYFVLASGMRVEAKDMQAVTDYPSNNTISAMTVEADNGYTYVRLKTAQKVSYKFSYTGSTVEITFNYTTGVPGGMDLDKNPMFSAARWKDSTLTLSLIKQGGLMGYKGYFDENGNLVFRFNNPPASMGSTKVVIDPGHGGSDPGGKGFLANYPEKVINLAIAQKLADELEARGASVLLLDTSKGMSLANRVAQAEKWGADIFVSVHNNTASRSSAAGTEVYYFYPFSQKLAANAAAHTSKRFNTINRGARLSYYHVTLSPQFASVLVECGFLTNKDEYEKLLKSSNQSNIAKGIADGIEVAVNAARTGSSATGEQSVGGGVASGGGAGKSGETGGDSIFSPSDSESSGAGGEGFFIDSDSDAEIALNKESLTIQVGQTVKLKATTVSETAAVTWKSGNNSVATVDEAGAITAHQEGTVKITASLDGGGSATCQVEVTGEEKSSSASDSGKKLADADNVFLDTSELELKASATHTLVVNSDIGAIRASDFSFASADSSVVSVDKNGKLTAKKAGDTEITVTSKNKQYELVCVVFVE